MSPPEKSGQALRGPNYIICFHFSVLKPGATNISPLRVICFTIHHPFQNPQTFGPYEATIKLSFYKKLFFSSLS